MALEHAIVSIREKHEDYIRQMPQQDLQRILNKQDEDGRYYEDEQAHKFLHMATFGDQDVVLCFRSLVHAAAAAGNLELVQYLLDQGASPNTSDDEASNTMLNLSWISMI